jgi:hypothetical protein
MKTTKIWPSVEITKNLSFVTFETWVRRKGKDGLWYRIFLFRKGLALNLEAVRILLEEFHSVAYSYSLLYIVDKQNEFVVLDEDQRSEEKRFMELTKPFVPPSR